MTQFDPTPSQKDAIETRGRSILVSAGAGSGKTRVLTQRLMGYVLDAASPADISSFVIITFTQAAAAELRGRIAQELSEALTAAEADSAVSEARKQHLRRQQALLRKAPIGTIHHFCASILRENGHAVGLTSDFKIISEERSSAMKDMILDRLLEQRYEDLSAYPGFEDLVNSVGLGRDDSRLAAVALSLYEKMQSHPRPESWARRCIAQLSRPCEDVGKTPWGEVMLAHARAIASYWAGELDRALAAMAAEPDVLAAYGDAIADGAAQIRELCRCLDLGWDRARACPPVKFPRMKALRGAKKTPLSERVKARKNDCAEAMKKIPELLYADSAVLEEELRQTAPAMQALLALVLDFENAYTAAKREENFADYSDLEHCTARLLTEEEGGVLRPSSLAESLASRYTEIMVDEYQDVSRVQETIFEAVSRQKKNLFLVGDVKQAIYRFRLADPEIFNEKYRTFALLPDAAPGAPAKILLRENFRSRSEILNCANAVFSSCMSRALGEIEYDEAASLVFGAAGVYPDPAPVPEVFLIEKEGAEEDAPEHRKELQEAAFVAEKILQLVSSGETVRGGNGPRPIGFGDIAVLLRNANSVGAVYRREFLRRGIPVVSGQGGGFFETKEISFVLSLLKTMDCPHDDVELSAVLSSPFYSFTPDELATVRSFSEGKDVDFYTCLQAAAAAGETRCAAFLQSLSSLRAQAPDLTADRLIRLILRTTEILPVCAAMPDGALRTANLYHLVDIAQNFEADGYQGLHRFVLYLKRLKSKGTESSAAEVADNCVQILSIHRSKGLEFPVVFLCDTARRFNIQDSQEPVLVHPQLGLGPKMTDHVLHAQIPTLARNAIAERLTAEMLSEEMRLLYVALTRPKERLYITAVQRSPEDYLEKQRDRLPLSGGRLEPEALSKARCYIDWLTLAALAEGEQHLKLRASVLSPQAGAAEVGEAEREAAEGFAEELALLREALAFSYPHAEAALLPSKITATELKHYAPASAPEDPEALPLVAASPGKISFRLPDFALQEKRVTPAERGIATHLALQYMDISRAETPEGIASEIARLEEGRFLSPRQAGAVDQKAIAALFASPLGRRIRLADRVHRELRFSLLCDAAALLPAPSGEELLLQGVVDCCLEENGELVIIDYKTDAVRTPGQLASRVRLYASQVKAYASALERMFALPVKETVLYFLACGEAVTIA